MATVVVTSGDRTADGTVTATWPSPGDADDGGYPLPDLALIDIGDGLAGHPCVGVALDRPVAPEGGPAKVSANSNASSRSS